MPAPTTVVLTDAPSDDDLALLSDELNRFNREASGTYDSRPLAVLVKDATTDRVIGGLTGRTSLGLLFVEVLYLPSALRGSGSGSEILRIAEEEARRRGCRSAVLYPISFQAPGFYERNGWRVFGEVPLRSTRHEPSVHEQGPHVSSACYEKISPPPHPLLSELHASGGGGQFVLT